MSYDPNVPSSSAENPATSEPKIRANFQAIKNAFNENHTDITLGSPGKHKYLSMPAQTSDPPTSDDEIALFAKGTPAKLYYKEQKNGKVFGLSIEDPTLAAPQGSTELVGGLIMKWGYILRSGTTGFVLFSKPFPNNIFNVQLTPGRSLPSKFRYDSTVPFAVTRGSDSSTGFSFWTTKSDTELFWLALGN